jgi:hypothetical protein
MLYNISIMAYEVTAGPTQAELPGLLEKFAREYGTAEDTRYIDYHGQSPVAVVLCAVTHQNHFLSVMRAPKADEEIDEDKPGCQGFPSGYLDSPEWTVAQHAQDELESEVGLVLPLERIRTFDSYILTKSQQNRAVIIYMAHVVLEERPEQLVLKPNELIPGSDIWVPRNALPSRGMFLDTPYAAAVALGEVTPGLPLT